MASVANKIKQLKAFRDIYVNRLGEIHNFSLRANLETDSTLKLQFKLRGESLPNLYRQFVENHQELVSYLVTQATADEGVAAEEVIRATFESVYFSVKAIYDNLFDQGQGTAVLPPPAPRSGINVKLPKIPLPIFNGDIKLWPSFIDLFNSLIHINSELTDMDKFQYLILSLSNEPLALVNRALPITAVNYYTAYQSLQNRYQNKRLLATAYWNEIVNCSRVTIESPRSLRQLLDTFSENLSALRNLQFPTEFWDFILFNLMLKKLDTSTATRFELEHSAHEVPSFDQLRNFVESQCKALDSLSYSKSEVKLTSMRTLSLKSDVKPFQKSARRHTTGISVNSAIVPSCIICTGAHQIYRCDQFLSRAPVDRFSLIKQKHLCINCLSDKHFSKNCASRSTCKTCRQKHHSLLHFENPSSRLSSAAAVFQPPQPLAGTSQAQAQSIQPVLVNSQSPTTVESLNVQVKFAALNFTALLPTALLQILDGRGSFLTVRAVIDTGSMASFITEKCFRRLGLPRSHYNVPIYAFGETVAVPAKGKTVCSMTSSYSPNLIINHEFVVVSNLCNNLPQTFFSLDSLSHVKELALSDPRFNIPAPVDMLLGVDILSQIWKSSVRTGQAGEPVAIETSFGWVIMGTFSAPCSTAVSTLFTSIDSSVELDTSLKRFWSLEEVPEKSSPLSSLEAQCEQIFVRSHCRDHSGRFHVRLPFNGEEPLFQNSRSVALKRFLSLERKLSLNPSLRCSYSEFIEEYLQLGQMEPIVEPFVDGLPQKAYYIPHHSVLKAESSTTKLRVVFDASTKNGRYSLNDHLLCGPKLQKDVGTILLKFRIHAIAFTADIKQMFRQIAVMPEHQDYQRILWRSTPQEPIKDFRIKVVTFGLASSPFLAQRTLLQLAEDENLHYPLASQIVSNDIYVDDIVTGCDSLETALSLKSELVALFKKGQFELRKWTSNSQEFLKTISLEDQEQILSFDQEPNSSVKILGLRWCPSQDSFSYNINLLERECTKRSILSDIARIFDPLGFLTPLTFFTKHLMQHLWTRGIGWDEPAPEDINSRWIRYRSELPLLSSLKIPRRILSDDIHPLELHGFADASEMGYAAVVYFRFTTPSNSIKVSLICARSKVAPLKRISLPRLELCAAVLLSNLIHFVLSTFSSLRFARLFAWSDSTVTLNWIKSEPYRWKTFISNRIAQIQEKVPAGHWFHVPSSLNPADCASRGLLPASLLNHDLWWMGPNFLRESIDRWPIQNFCPDEDRMLGIVEPERRKLTLAIAVDTPKGLDYLLQRYSSLSKILRIICYLLRFCKRSQPQDWVKNETDAFDQIELHFALISLVRHVQSSCFSKDLSLIKNQHTCSKPIKRLCPFIDRDGLLRVGGRLERSSLPYDQKHPLLLPRDHRLTQLIIQHYHDTFLHPGTQTLHYLLAQNFWILSVKRAVRSCIHRCIRCFRVNPRPASTKMADLPSFRISQLKPFQFVGVDFGGPFSIKLGRLRGSKITKSYLCLFVCATTKALHLELVSELSTDAFLAGLRRFISRRGRCSDIFSDQGTNFVGASRYLTDCMRTAVESELIKWHFNPPAAPHFGGLYEAGIKSVKSHLSKVLGNQILTYEELYTVLTQIEAVLNSRPLCELSNDPNDLSALTPGHFLTLNPLSTIPDPDLTSLNINRLDRWQLLVRVHQDFWRRWHNEYLHTLQQRGKWEKTPENIKLDSLVLVKDDQLRPLHWLLGRVTEVHPGSDGIVRVVTIRTASGSLKRSVTKLCPLPFS